MPVNTGGHLEKSDPLEIVVSPAIGVDDFTHETETIGNLSFNLGDGGDWYILPIPAGGVQFGSTQTIHLSPEMISIEFLNDFGQPDECHIRNRPA